MSDKPVVNISDWLVVGNQLTGKVQDHPRFDKDTQVKTSYIVESPMVPEEGDTIETMNTIYKLGKEYV